MENEIIFMHMTQGDLEFMNRDYLALSLWSDGRRAVFSFFQWTEQAGMRQPAGCCLCFAETQIQVVHCTLWQNESPKPPPKSTWIQYRKNMAGCQVHKSSVNNACCFLHTTHTKYTEADSKNHKEAEASEKATQWNRMWENVEMKMSAIS